MGLATFNYCVDRICSFNKRDYRDHRACSGSRKSCIFKPLGRDFSRTLLDQHRFSNHHIPWKWPPKKQILISKRRRQASFLNSIFFDLHTWEECLDFLFQIWFAETLRETTYLLTPIPRYFYSSKNAARSRNRRNVVSVDSWCLKIKTKFRRSGGKMVQRRTWRNVSAVSEKLKLSNDKTIISLALTWVI